VSVIAPLLSGVDASNDVDLDWPATIARMLNAISDLALQPVKYGVPESKIPLLGFPHCGLDEFVCGLAFVLLQNRAQPISKATPLWATFGVPGLAGLELVRPDVFLIRHDSLFFR
jgi:hypothetical protein